MYIAFAALTSKIFAPGEDLTGSQFVLPMDHTVKNNKNLFSFQITFYSVNISIIYPNLTN